MELRELTAYAEETYQIHEEFKWADFPGFSVLCHPQTGKWVALLMRQWDTESGTQIERCDLKCGVDSLFRYPRPYLSAPVRMRGGRWVGISFDARTEAETVFRLFDKAVTACTPHGYTLVLDAPKAVDGGGYRETALPPFGRDGTPAEAPVPEQLWKLRRLNERRSGLLESRARAFYRQAVFMQDYTDDYPWSGDFIRYFPTYRDLSTRQLRGYFSWRTKVREGIYEPIATSAAYLYLYELLNGVGASSPEDVLRKLEAFEKGYLIPGVGDLSMRSNLRRWMLEYAVLAGFPPEAARRAADPDLIKGDEALSVLRRPETRCDDEVFSALCHFEGGKLAGSAPVRAEPERSRHLIAEVWRAASRFRRDGKDLFTLCFGRRRTRAWHPLGNALYYERETPEDRIYPLDECRSYRCKNGVWSMTSYEPAAFDRRLLQGFVHEVDARLRLYLGSGRKLTERPADAWAIPYIECVLEADRQALLDAERKKISIDLTGLDRIRRDAAKTRDRLLTEEDLEVSGAAGPEETIPAVPVTIDAVSRRLSLDEIQLLVLRALLQGDDVSDLLRDRHLMPSIAADLLNEALFDEIGDTAVLCDGDRLSLVEDYREDLERLLGGNDNE